VQTFCGRCWCVISGRKHTTTRRWLATALLSTYKETPHFSLPCGAHVQSPLVAVDFSVFLRCENGHPAADAFPISLAEGSQGAGGDGRFHWARVQRP
jgi:hypothetical protein